MQNLKNMMSTSEFWMSAVLGAGQLGAVAGWWTHEDFNKFVIPLVTYVIARLTSKVAKAATGK